MITASPVAPDMMECRLDAITLTIDQYRRGGNREMLRGLTSRLESMSYDLAIAAIELDRYFAGTQEDRKVWASIRALDRHVDQLERHYSDFPPDKLWFEAENAYFRALDVFRILLPGSKSVSQGRSSVG